MKELIGKKLLVSKSYYVSDIIEVIVVDAVEGNYGDLVKLQRIGDDTTFWERVKNIKIEKIYDN
jgi:hypothetical protein